MKDLRCMVGLHRFERHPRNDGSSAFVCSRCSKHGRPWNGNVYGASRDAQQAQKDQRPWL